jgi:type I restriction enzyme S subunit
LAPEEIVARAEGSGTPGLLARHERWPRVRLGDLITVVNGAAYPSREFNTDGVGEPLIRIRDVGINQPNTFFNGAWDETHRVNPGDLLVGMDGDFRAATWEGPPALLNQRVCRLDIKDSRLDPRWLRHTIQGYLDAIWNETSSVTVKHLSSRSIASIPLPLPPLHEQRLIADMLDDQLSRIGAGAASLDQAHKKLVALAEVALERAFAVVEGDQITLGDVARWGSGGTPTAGSRAYYEGGTIPWIVSGDLKDTRLGAVDRFITEAGFASSSAKWVPEGAVLVAMYGATIGRLALVDSPVTTNQAVAHAVPIEGLMTSDYLFWFLRSQRHRLVAAGQGGAQPNISQRVLKSWPISVPPLQEQALVVARVRETMDARDRLLADLANFRRKHEGLVRAVKIAALSGRLRDRSMTMEATDG